MGLGLGYLCLSLLQVAPGAAALLRARASEARDQCRGLAAEHGRRASASRPVRLLRRPQ